MQACNCPSPRKTQAFPGAVKSLKAFKSATHATQRQITITTHEKTTVNQQAIIGSDENGKSCWRCYFLEKRRAETLTNKLFFTIVISLIKCGLAVVKTPEEIISNKKIMWALGSIGIVVVVLLFCWKIARHRYLPHQQH
jgi:hypothetical protein